VVRVDFDWDEVNALIHILHTWGVNYLIGSDPPAQDIREDDPVRLIQRLASCGYPLVEDASISLFILHPELAPAVVTALQESEPEIAENIAVATLATLYMQQWWLFPLAFALGRLPSFPEEPFAFLWEERGLPPPASGYGRDGLLALQDYRQRSTGLPLNFLDGWQNQINHLLTQEESYQRSLSDTLVQMLKQIARSNLDQCMKRKQTA
jgi:hypothetical protein